MSRPHLHRRAWISDESARRKLATVHPDPVWTIRRARHLARTYSALHLNHLVRSCRKLCIDAERKTSLREVRVDEDEANILLHEKSFETFAVTIWTRSWQRLPRTGRT